MDKSDDFVVRFATVNGSGTASANAIIAKSIFRMGISVGSKNRIPSNIQGMPTYYDIRVSSSGWRGPCDSVSLLLALNRLSLQDDQKKVRTGGVVVYDDAAFLAPEHRRSELSYIPIPLTRLAQKHFGKVKQRMTLQNVIYVGFMVSLLQIDPAVALALIDQRYSGKELAPLNCQAFEIGYDAGRSHSCPFVVSAQQRSIDCTKKIFVDGNYAAALGCLYAGATVVGWYPITPSTSLVENFKGLCDRYRRGKDDKKTAAIIQCEDEICAIGVVIGAQWMGARAFTATSGPGLSLMNEFLGYAYYSETPAVLFDVQRAGPSTGLPTNTQQADLTLAAFASHGDTKQVLLFPGTVKECFSMAVEAFDIAERLQTPVIVMSDLNLGMNSYVSDPFEWEQAFDRGKRLESVDYQPYHRYEDRDGDHIPYRSLPGIDPKLAFFTRGSGHDKFGRYTEDPQAYQDLMERLDAKLTKASANLPAPEHKHRGSKDCLVYFGSTEEIIAELDASLDNKFDLVRIRSFPFPRSLEKRLQQYRRVIVLEQNRDAQMARLVLGEFKGLSGVETLNCYDGEELSCEKVLKLWPE